MLPEFKFHHIGVAVKDIDSTAAIYVEGGYSRSSAVFDPEQNVTVCWLTRDGYPTVELIAPGDDRSPVSKTLEKVGVSPYHCCYTADDIDDAVAKLRKQKYVAIGKPVKAVALRGSRVCFLYNKNVGLIELAEAPAEIIK